MPLSSWALYVQKNYSKQREKISKMQQIRKGAKLTNAKNQEIHSDTMKMLSLIRKKDGEWNK